jgi:hypothetical protein
LHQYHPPGQEASQVLHCKALVFYLCEDSKGEFIAEYHLFIHFSIEELFYLVLEKNGI